MKRETKPYLCGRENAFALTLFQLLNEFNNSATTNTLLEQIVYTYAITLLHVIMHECTYSALNGVQTQ